MENGLRSRHERRLVALKKERSAYETQWQELNDYIAPGRYRMGDAQDPKGRKDRGKIVDNSPLLAHRVARSGMQAGLTSPTRPWMRYSTFDDDLREYGPVKDYLYQSTRKARDFLSVSNIYNCLHSCYGDELLFGQFCILLSRDAEDRLRADQLVTGQYWLAQNVNQRVDTCYRRVWMTVEQVVGRFVARREGGMDWSRASSTVKNLYERGNYDEWVEVMHAVEPRRDRDWNNPGKAHKAFLSNYWEVGQSADVMLEVSGFDRNPILAPRWDVVGEDVYAAYCPGMDALPDVKMLQIEQKRKGEGIDKKVRPPMVAPTSLRNQRNSSLPGSITYVDEANAGAAYRPAFDVNISLAELAADIAEVNRRIDRAFYADLFMAITNMQGVQPKNVYELTQRKEEQLQQLGPTIERSHHELIIPLADWVFYALDESNLLPPPPPELQGQELRIENVSTLAQAQLAVSTGSIERLMSFAGNMSAVFPEALDKIDADQSIDEYADALGVMPTIIRSDDEVAQMRAERAQQQEAQQAANMASQMMPAIKQGADAAKVLSEADANGGPPELLSRLGLG
jgi:hypothetical protein